MREIGTIGENGESFLHFSYTLTWTRPWHAIRTPPLCLLSWLPRSFPRRSEGIRIVFFLATANDGTFPRGNLRHSCLDQTSSVENRVLRRERDR